MKSLMKRERRAVMLPDRSDAHNSAGSEFRRSMTIALALLAGLALSGCATVYEGKYDFHQGWRAAKVLKVGSASDIATGQSSDCRRQATPEQLASSRFALLAYIDFSRGRHRVVPLAADQMVRPGDHVYMRLRSCDTPLGIAERQGH